MKPSLERRCFSPGTRRLAAWAAIGFAFYVLSTGPVAWATNDGLHAAYLPEQVNAIYLPLALLARIPGVGDALYWWTAVVWHGFPAGYTTL
jgi:hypothetical protein